MQQPQIVRYGGAASLSEACDDDGNCVQERGPDVFGKISLKRQFFAKRMYCPILYGNTAVEIWLKDEWIYVMCIFD